MKIPEDIQKEWNDHLTDCKNAVGLETFSHKASYTLLELSSIFSGYALDIALENKPPVSIVWLYSSYIKALMHMNYVLDNYLWSDDRTKLFIKFIEDELIESKELLEKVMDMHTKHITDR